MIITRTPLRISLGGGGTDLPSYYRHAGGGFLVAAAIDKYVYIAVHRNFDDDLLLKYSEVERVAKPEEIAHALLREVLLSMGVTKGIEISSMADVPAGTGLGSSGAFTVGVLKALFAHQRRTASVERIAELACAIEIERLGAPVGKQDPYISAIGGVTGFTFHPDERVDVVPLEIPEEARLQLEENLLLFYTGQRRSAAEELRSQQENTSIDADGVRQNLDEVRALGRESMTTLQAGDLGAFGQLMTAQWELKLSRAPSALHQQIDSWIRSGIGAGASGGKLVGAGGGGFLLLYAEPKADVRAVMSEVGLEEIRFGFDYQGSTTIVG